MSLVPSHWLLKSPECAICLLVVIDIIDIDHTLIPFDPYRCYVHIFNFYLQPIIWSDSVVYQNQRSYSDASGLWFGGCTTVQCQLGLVFARLSKYGSWIAIMSHFFTSILASRSSWPTLDLLMFCCHIFRLSPCWCSCGFIIIHPDPMRLPGNAIVRVLLLGACLLCWFWGKICLG